jgi:hypothetical protein
MAGWQGLSRLSGWKGFGHRLTNLWADADRPVGPVPDRACRQDVWTKTLGLNSRCGKSNQKGKAASFQCWGLHDVDPRAMVGVYVSYPFRTPAVRWRPSTCPCGPVCLRLLLGDQPVGLGAACDAIISTDGCLSAPPADSGRAIRHHAFGSAGR